MFKWNECSIPYRQPHIDNPSLSLSGPLSDIAARDDGTPAADDDCSFYGDSADEGSEDSEGGGRRSQVGEVVGVHEVGGECPIRVCMNTARYTQIHPTQGGHGSDSEGGARSDTRAPRSGPSSHAGSVISAAPHEEEEEDEVEGGQGGEGAGVQMEGECVGNGSV